MIRIVAAIFLYISVAFSASAQFQYSPEATAEKETQWMIDNLHLKQAQVNRAATVSLKHYIALAKVVGQEKQLQALHRRKDLDMKDILNREQYQRYLKREKQLRAQGF